MVSLYPWNMIVFQSSGSFNSEDRTALNSAVSAMDVFSDMSHHGFLMAN